MLARFNRKTAAVLSGVTASLLMMPPPAFAQGPVVVHAQPSDVRVERVIYADLDLAKGNGARQLERRVAGAVKRVCLFEDSRTGLQDRGYYDCSDEAWSGAKPQIALAVDRAREIALNGQSSIAASAIVINVAAR